MSSVSIVHRIDTEGPLNESVINQDVMCNLKKGDCIKINIKPR